MAHTEGPVLRPHEIARQDQMLAAAVDDALHDPSAVVTVRSYATDADLCEWCECEGEDHELTCEDCPTPAVYVLTTTYALSGSRALPVCTGHCDSAERWLRRVLADVPATFEHLPVRDGDGVR